MPPRMKMNVKDLFCPRAYCSEYIFLVYDTYPTSHVSPGRRTRLPVSDGRRPFISEIFLAASSRTMLHSFMRLRR